MEEVLFLHFSILIEGQIAKHELHDDVFVRHPSSSLINFLELPIKDLNQVFVSVPVGDFEHIQQFFDLLSSFGIEDVTIFNHVDEKHLLAIFLVVVVGDIVLIVI
jgi:hypothetical protein